MHVTRVELENIKSYERARFDFARGTTAIVGHNGAGKTTILEAIAWSLFDVLDYSKDDFVRRGAKRGTVRVTFESDVDKRQYTVVRDTGTGYHVFDPVLSAKLVEKKTDVGAFLRVHLGIEPGTDLQALFRSAIGVPQGTLTADFLKSAAQRKAAFDRLLKVEEYRESAERLRETLSLIRERLTDVRERIAGAEGRLAHYDEKTAEHLAATKRSDELTHTLEELNREASARARTVQEFDDAERNVNETRAVRERSTVEREALARRLSDVQIELEAAMLAVARQRATESDYQTHLKAVDELRGLEKLRVERDGVRAKTDAKARAVVKAESDVRRIADAVSAAETAERAARELEPNINEQHFHELERERLRELLAEANAARTQLARLDKELEVLRAQHTQTKERMRAAEGLSEAREQIANLESERLAVETDLSKAEQARATHEQLNKQKREQTREVVRLRQSVTTLERETQALIKSANGAARVGELETRAGELAQQAATLRAEIARDEKMRAEMKGGLCPILSERCLNIPAGQTLENYFTDHLSSNRTALSKLETESARLDEMLRGAREATIAAARLETGQARLAEEKTLLVEREKSLTEIESELARTSQVAARFKELSGKLTSIDAVLKKARDEAESFAQLKTLQERLREIEAEGTSKKEARKDLAALANGATELEKDFAATEKRLRALGDPRGRAAALRAEAERAKTLKVEETKAREQLLQLETEQRELTDALARFSDLDERWSDAATRRDATVGAHREYLECAALAATVTTRTLAATKAEEDASRAAHEAEQAHAAHEQALKNYDRARHENERVALTLARERIASTKAQLENARERTSRLSEEIARLDEVRASLREEFQAKENLERLQETTDFVRDVLKQAGPIVTESYLYNISLEANQLFREITGDAARTLKWSRDYEIVLEDGGYERSFPNLSGGEQMAAALSIRLALLKQLSDIRIAFFDEPTVNLDEERRKNLAEQIGQVRHFDQLFVISHDDTFEDAVDHVVTVARATD